MSPNKCLESIFYKISGNSARFLRQYNGMMNFASCCLARHALAITNILRWSKQFGVLGYRFKNLVTACGD